MKTSTKHTRTRPKASCDDCYRRKQKCDRKWPCSHCLDRKVGHTCHFSTTNPSSTRTAKGRAESKAKLQARNQQEKQEEHRQCQNPPLNDESAEDSSSAAGSTSSYSPHLQPPSTPIEGSEKPLDGLGYLDNHEDNLLGYLRIMRIFEEKDIGSELDTQSTKSFTLTPEISEILKKMPPRPVTEILVQHFLSEANWIYEMVYPRTFIERYDKWWSSPYRTVDDLQFAALLLRICAYSAQFLPSQRYLADTILGSPISSIREQCHITALSLTGSLVLRAGAPSITRIHEKFFHACYLKNEGQLKGSWDVLSEAIHEAHELGLHLEPKRRNGKPISEYDTEMGKRTYWNLWLWDKFMSIVLGRWPLIPDQRCTVSLPSDVFGARDPPNPGVPSIFGERKLQIELAKLGSEFLSPNDGKPSTEPTIMDQNMRKLKTELIDKLPPAFKLRNADEQWDEELPHLAKQRQMLRISILATMVMLLRPMIVIPARQVLELPLSDQRLIARHKLSLVSAAMEMLDSVARLHSLMGGKHNRFFLLSFFTLEPAAILGMYLINSPFGTKESKHKTSSADNDATLEEREMWEGGFTRLEEAILRLEMLSEVSLVAKEGLKVLTKIMARVRVAEAAKILEGKRTVQRTKSISRPRSPASIASSMSTLSEAPITPARTNATDTSQATFSNSLHTPPTPALSYDLGQLQDTPPSFNALSADAANIYSLNMPNYKDPFHNSVDWDASFSSGMLNHSLPIYNAASMGWNTDQEQSTVDLTMSMNIDQSIPEMLLYDSFDWGWIGDGGQHL